MLLKKNILHLNNSNARSQYLLSIGRYHDASKYNLTIGCFDSYGPLNSALASMAIPTVNIPAKGVFGYFCRSFALFRLLKRKKIDILHLHTFYPSFFGVLIGKLAGIKTIVITRHHANQHIKLNKKVHIKIDSWTAKNCHKVIAVSEYTKKIMVDYEKIPGQKIKVIYNGISPLKSSRKSKKELCDELHINPASTLFLCISRFYKEKNIETAIRSINKVNQKGFDSTLLIAGAGLDTKYYKDIKKLIQELNLEDKIICLGFREDIGDLLQACDALIHPSLEESFGFAVLEAMSAGKPIFASNIPAINEVATDEVACLFNPTCSEELTGLLLNWSDKKQDSLLRVSKGLDRYKMYFTFSAMMKEYEKYYEE
ncbi:MAG TPA: glycosyltransferase family 4 protein [Bacteroidia bacterium]|jgi:glycosyltransferase involved in cell wall biosynthesis|nr:glycosyltransferase family 4 protein [Bacteroidia bacterium]